MRMIRELLSNRRGGGRGPPLTERERHDRIRKIAATRDHLDNRFQREDLERQLQSAATPYERRQATVS